MINVVSVIKTCESVPAQWEGRTDDDCAVYVRYRYGWLTIGVSEPGGSIDDAIDAPDAFASHCGAEFDGQMSAEELMQATVRLFSWPPGFA